MQAQQLGIGDLVIPFSVLFSAVLTIMFEDLACIPSISPATLSPYRAMLLGVLSFILDQHLLMQHPHMPVEQCFSSTSILS